MVRVAILNLTFRINHSQTRNSSSVATLNRSIRVKSSIFPLHKVCSF